MLRLREPIQKITYELGAAGVGDGELLALISRDAFSYEQIRNIAARLLEIRTRVELREYD